LRDAFEELTPEIIEYCKLECRHLVEMMTSFRQLCHDLDIHPRQWSGAGEIATALLIKYGVPKRPLTGRELGMRSDKKQQDQIARGLKIQTTRELQARAGRELEAAVDGKELQAARKRLMLADRKLQRLVDHKPNQRPDPRRPARDPACEKIV